MKDYEIPTNNLICMNNILSQGTSRYACMNNIPSQGTSRYACMNNIPSQGTSRYACMNNIPSQKKYLIHLHNITSHPGSDTSLETSYLPISHLYPAAKVLEYLILTTINTYLQPTSDQHRFRPDHSTTSALLQMTTNIAMGFNQRKPPDRTICVAVDLSAAFDIVCHNNLLS